MSRRLGAQGETLAAAYLQRVGYRILARNYTCRCGELDLVAEQDGCLCFIEVKSRRSASFGGPAAAVNREKQRRIARAAAHYLQAFHPGPPPACRFDVVALHDQGEPELIPDAFRVE